MEPCLVLQAAIRSRLTASSAVTALVPAANIRDANGLPSVFPCILIGEGMTSAGGDVARKMHEAVLDLHVWATEPGTVVSKQIAAAIRAALSDTNWNLLGLHVADLHVVTSRFLRDPSGKSHGVISLTAIVKEIA